METSMNLDLERSLGALIASGISLWTDGEQLRFRAREGALAAEDRALLRENKHQICTMLDGRCAAPLSSVERRLWFLSRFAGESPAYTVAAAYRIRGALDRSRFDAALTELVSRHAALRSTFAELGGHPIRWIGRPFAVRSEVHRSADPAEMRALAVRPFDLARGPLFRSFFFEDGETVLWLLTAYHGILDGFSLGRLVFELSDSYCGRVLEPPEIEPDLEPARPEDLAWWRERLDGMRRLELPLDRPRPPVRTHAGRMHVIPLGCELTAELADFARARGHTLFGALLTAFSVLLSRYGGQEDVAVGTPWANRLDRRLERALGCFVSTLVMRSTIDPSLSYAELLDRTRAFFLDACDRPSVSFEELVAALEPERDTSKSPLFSTFFALQDAYAGLSLPGLQTEWVDFDLGVVQFDLELHVLPSPGGLRACFLYNTDLFDDGTIERLGRRFVHLARELLRAPDRPVRDASLLTEEDRAWYARWNDTASEISEPLVDAQIRRRAIEREDEIAVVCGDARLTRGELESRVARLAARIARSPSALVGLFAERSAEMVIGLLAILRAGRGFVPLDPDFPPARLAAMIEQSGLSLLLTTPGARLPRLSRSIETVEISDREPIAPLEVSPAKPDDIAYVIYTSGSTGQPKGVAVTQDNLRACLHAFSMLVDPEDVLVAVTTLSFDISLLEILLPLARGARLVIATAGETRDGRRLARLLGAERATIMQATPATYGLLLDAGWRGGIRALCGGEALPPSLAQELDRCCELFNMYGPTETTIWSSAIRLHPGDPVLLGPPAPNERFYVVDERGSLCPPDVPGELYIAGSGVARGYLSRPDLTAERFVDFLNERCYRTGDRVRAREDGTLLFLGRGDHQLKVRGFRIEAAEVETALLAHPAVREAAVVAAPSAKGSVLVAHLVTASPVEPAALRAHLLERIPQYMVPSIYVMSAALPRTPNGKIDRASLPTPSAAAGSEHEEPEGPIERGVAEAFAAVLDLPRVGRSTDFFSAGGHSLLAVQVLAELRRRFRVELTFRDFFSGSTVERVARAVERAQIERLLASSEAELLRELESASEEQAARWLALMSAR